MNRRPLPLALFLLPTSLALASGADDRPLELQAPGKTQTVAAEEAIRDIHGPLPLPDHQHLMIITAGLLLALAILFILYRLWKRRRRAAAAVPPLPWEEALQSLAEARHLLAAGNSLAYLERTAQILRRYVELRFSLPSTRQTTRELLSSLGDDDASPLSAYRQDLRAFLERADLAKFAHHAGDLRQLEEVESSLRQFIERTALSVMNGERP